MHPNRQVLSFFIVLIVLTITLAPMSAVRSAPLPQESIPAALTYLLSQQLPDGGLPGLSGTSDISTTARALLALKAVGQDAASFKNAEGLTPVDYVVANTEAYVYDQNLVLFPGNAGLILAALATVGQTPADLPQALLDTLQADGSIASDASSEFLSGVATGLSQSLAVLGLAASQISVPQKAITFLVKSQVDGLWDNGFGPDLDTSAMAVISLITSGQLDYNSPAIQSAFSTIRASQLENAGWKPDWDSDELNVDTTGWITLALVTAGENLSDWSKNGISPQDALSSQQKEDGSIGGTYVGVYSTIEALLGYAETPLFSAMTSIQDNSAVAPMENKAALVVTMPDGSTQQRCLPFTSEAITGFEFLQTSGLILATVFDPSMGPAVCSIEGQGCPSDDCFCAMPDYWSYWHLENGEWGYSPVGAGTFKVQPGSIEGWGWGDTPPLVTSYEAICADNAQIFIPAVSRGEDAPSGETGVNPLQPDAKPTDEPAAPSNGYAIPKYLTFVLFGALVLVLILVLVLTSIIIKNKKK